MTKTLSRNLIKVCKKELKEYAPDPVLTRAFKVLGSIFGLLNGKKEKLLTKKELITVLDDLFNNSFISEFDFSAFLKRLQQAEFYANTKKEDEFEYLGLTSMLDFFNSWIQDNTHMLRLIRQDEISLFPLDPSDITQPVFSNVHASIVMSGTLYPPEIYADILGIGKDNRILKEYSSPFPKENRLLLSSEILSTVYHRRNEMEFRKMGNAISEIINIVPDNVAVFFPSYKLIKDISKYLNTTKEIILESQDWKKEDKRKVMDMMYEKNNLALLGVQLGSFSEGIDFENNALKGVVIVGIPLSPLL